MIFAAAGKTALRQILLSIFLFLMETKRNGSQNRHAAKYRSRFCVHKSRKPARYVIKIGPNDQKNSTPMQANVAERSIFRMFTCLLTKSLWKNWCAWLNFRSEHTEESQTQIFNNQKVVDILWSLFLTDRHKCVLFVREGDEHGIHTAVIACK